jgi:hypothetical protein
MAGKVTDQLLKELDSSDSSKTLDVVIELRSENEPNTRQSQSRAEKIAAMKESFVRDAAPIEEFVRNAGGELKGEAWINRTLRARVPIDTIKRLSEQEQVVRVDVPHALEPESRSA